MRLEVKQVIGVENGNRIEYYARGAQRRINPQGPVLSQDDLEAIGLDVFYTIRDRYDARIARWAVFFSRSLLNKYAGVVRASWRQQFISLDSDRGRQLVHQKNNQEFMQHWVAERNRRRIKCRPSLGPQLTEARQRLLDYLEQVPEALKQAADDRLTETAARSRRLHRGVTLSDVAAHLGVSNAAISKILASLEVE